MRFPALFRPLVLLGLILASTLGGAATAWAADAAALAGIGAGAEDDFVPAEQAYKLSALATAADRIELTFKIHPGTYLYRSKMKFTAMDGQPAAIGTPDLPRGEIKEDEFFGKQEVYNHDISAKLPVSRGSKDAFTLRLKVNYQGCAERGICYPPVQKTIDLVTMTVTNGAAAVPLRDVQTAAPQARVSGPAVGRRSRVAG